jgi:hypothetical protein
MNQGLNHRYASSLVIQVEDRATITSLHELFLDPYFGNRFSMTVILLLCFALIRAYVVNAIATRLRHQPPDPHRAAITATFTGPRRKSCKQKKPRGPRLRVQRIVIGRLRVNVESCVHWSAHFVAD